MYRLLISSPKYVSSLSASHLLSTFINKIFLHPYLHKPCKHSRTLQFRLIAPTSTTEHTTAINNAVPPFPTGEKTMNNTNKFIDIPSNCSISHTTNGTNANMKTSWSVESPSLGKMAYMDWAASVSGHHVMEHFTETHLPKLLQVAGDDAEPVRLHTAKLVHKFARNCEDSVEYWDMVARLQNDECAEVVSAMKGIETRLAEVLDQVVEETMEMDGDGVDEADEATGSERAWDGARDEEKSGCKKQPSLFKRFTSRRRTVKEMPRTPQLDDVVTSEEEYSPDSSDSVNSSLASGKKRSVSRFSTFVGLMRGVLKRVGGKKLKIRSVFRRDKTV